MELRKEFKTKTELDGEGAVFELGDEEDSGRIWLRRSNYEPYRRALEIAITKERRGKGSRIPVGAIMRKVNPKLVGQYLVIRWENIKDNGNLLEDNKQAYVKALEKYPDFYQLVFNYCDDPVNYQDEELEDIMGKSETEQNSSLRMIENQ